MKVSVCAKAISLLSVTMASHAFAADCTNGVNATGSCTVPVGVSSIVIEVWGGGGGGGANAEAFSGGGGGGGSYCKNTFAVAAGTILNVQTGEAGGLSRGGGFHP